MHTHKEHWVWANFFSTLFSQGTTQQVESILIMKNLGETKPMIRHNLHPLIEIGLTYLKIYVRQLLCLPYHWLRPWTKEACLIKQNKFSKCQLLKRVHKTLVETQEHENKNVPSNMILPHCKMCCAARDDVGLYPIN